MVSQRERDGCSADVADVTRRSPGELLTILRYNRRRRLDGSEGMSVSSVLILRETRCAVVEIVTHSAVVADEEWRERGATPVTVER